MSVPPLCRFRSYLSIWRILGGGMTSWRTWVGCLPTCLIIATQYLIYCVRSGVIQIHWLVPTSATWIGEKSPASPGIPKDAYWRLPANFLGFFLMFLLCFFMLWSRSRIFLFCRLASAVWNIGHWKFIRIFLSCIPTFHPLFLASFMRLSCLIHVEWFQRAK